MYLSCYLISVYLSYLVIITSDIKAIIYLAILFYLSILFRDYPAVCVKTMAKFTSEIKADLSILQSCFLSLSILFSDYPAVCVKTMAKISREAEACVWNERFFEDLMRAVCNTFSFLLNNLSRLQGYVNVR